MAAESTFYSRYDIAALMALVNMLKINLMDRPEIYRTLLAMLSDLESRDTVIRNKIVKYMKLMITDQVLLNCLLMSLPEGLISRPKPIVRTLPKPDKILLPPKTHHSLRSKKLRYGSGSSFKSLKVRKLPHTVPEKPLKQPSTSGTFSVSDLQQVVSERSTSCSSEDTPTTIETQTDDTTHGHCNQKQVHHNKSDKVTPDHIRRREPASHQSNPEILQRSDDSKPIMIVGTNCFESCYQGQGHHVPQGFLSPVVTSLGLPLQYQGLPNSHYPGLIGYPAGMMVRPVLPWQPLNMIPAGHKGQIPSGLLQHKDDMSNGEIISGMDLTFKPVKMERRPNLKRNENDFTRQHIPDSLKPKKILSADELLLKQNEVRHKSVLNDPLMAQNLKINSRKPAAENLDTVTLKANKDDTTSLEALAELTSRIGYHDTYPSNERMNIGAQKSASTGSLCLSSNKEKISPVFPKVSPGILTAKSSVSCITQSSLALTKNFHCHNKEKDKNTVVKSFPYSQEIKLPDGKYFLLNSSAEKKIVTLRNEKRAGQISDGQQLKVPLPHGYSTSSASTDASLTKHSVSQQISQGIDMSRTNETSNRHTVVSMASPDIKSDVSKIADPTKMFPQSVIKSEVPPSTKTEEKKCIIQLHNTTTNKLITELLRKRAKSEGTLGANGPSEKKVRLLSDSELATKMADNLRQKPVLSVSDVPSFDKGEEKHDSNKKLTVAPGQSDPRNIDTCMTPCQDGQLAPDKVVFSESSQNVCDKQQIVSQNLDNKKDEPAVALQSPPNSKSIPDGLFLQVSDFQQSVACMTPGCYVGGPVVSPLLQSDGHKVVTSTNSDTDLDSQSSDFDEFFDNVFIN